MPAWSVEWLAYRAQPRAGRLDLAALTAIGAEVAELAEPVPETEARALVLSAARLLFGLTGATPIIVDLRGGADTVTTALGLSTAFQLLADRAAELDAREAALAHPIPKEDAPCP